MTRRLDIRRTPGLPSITFLYADITDADRIRASIRSAMPTDYPLDRITIDASGWPDEASLVAAIVVRLRTGS